MKVTRWYMGLLTLMVMAFGLAQESDVVALRQAAEANPENVSGWVNLGQGYLQLERYEEAKEAFLEATALDYRAANAHFGLGLAEYGRGDYQAALFAFNEVTRLFPERFDGHYNRAVTLVRLRRREDAVAAFESAIAEAEPEASDEDKISAYLGLAGQLKLLERYSDAAGAYEQALALREGDPELIYLRAQALYQASDGLEALPDLVELEAATSDYRVSALIADIYVEAGQVDRALRSLERAERRARESGDSTAEASILINLGLLKRGLGRDAESVSALQRATRVDPSSWRAYYNLGVSYLETGQARSALDALNRASELERDSGELYFALATAYDQLNRPEEARRNAEAALARLTEENLVLNASRIVGRSYYRLGDYRRALDTLEDVISARPEDAEAQLWAGLSAYELGDYGQAAQYYERAVQLDPDNLDARSNLGAAYLASQQYEDAELVYQLILQQNSADAESHYNLGWALLAQNQRGEAREAWQRAAELNYTPAREALAEYF